MFSSLRSAKLVRKRLRLKPAEIQLGFHAINYVKCEDRAICNHDVNDINKRSVVDARGRVA